MAVDVTDSTASGLSASVEAAAERLLELLHCVDSELSVLLVGDLAMRALNCRWRGEDRATDVLSFSQLEDQGANPGASRAGRAVALKRIGAGGQLGDVVISVDTADTQAREGGWTLEEEINRLLVHGVLHLLGYEHESGGMEEARMRAEEARLSTALIADGLPCAHESP